MSRQYKRLVTALSIILLIGLGLLGYRLAQIIPQGGVQQPDRGAPEGAQLREAATHSSGLVLTSVRAVPIEDPYPTQLGKNLPFQATFTYEGPYADFTFVQFRDGEADPIITDSSEMWAQVEESVENIGFPAYVYDPTKLATEEYKRAISNVKLGPRDLYELTRSDAAATLGQENAGYIIEARLRFRGDYGGIPTHLVDRTALWSIYYFGIEPTLKVEYLLDPTTGEILERTVTGGEKATYAP